MTSFHNHQFLTPLGCRADKFVSKLDHFHPHPLITIARVHVWVPCHLYGNCGNFLSRYRRLECGDQPLDELAGLTQSRFRLISTRLSPVCYRGFDQEGDTCSGGHTNRSRKDFYRLSSVTNLYNIIVLFVIKISSFIHPSMMSATTPFFIRTSKFYLRLKTFLACYYFFLV